VEAGFAGFIHFSFSVFKRLALLFSPFVIPSIDWFMKDSPLTH
jgi:hypothetical protein